MVRYVLPAVIIVLTVPTTSVAQDPELRACFFGKKITFADRVRPILNYLPDGRTFSLERDGQIGEGRWEFLPGNILRVTWTPSGNVRNDVVLPNCLLRIGSNNSTVTMNVQGAAEALK